MFIGVKCVRINCGLLCGGRRGEGVDCAGNSCSRPPNHAQIPAEQMVERPKRPVAVLKALVDLLSAQNDPQGCRPSQLYKFYLRTSLSDTQISALLVH